MFTIKEIIDGMECFFKFTGHSRDQMIERSICYDDVIDDVKLNADEIFSLKNGEEVTLVNDIKKYMYCVAVKSDEDYNTLIYIKTVINNNARLKKSKYIDMKNKEEK